MSGIVSDTGKSAKSIAQKVARQVAREPFEVLRDVPSQILSSETSAANISDKTSSSDGKPNLSSGELNKLNQADKVKGKRFLDALESEVKDIQRNNLYSDLMAKIQSGEYVPLENYPELSMEEKQVLKAQ